MSSNQGVVQATALTGLRSGMRQRLLRLLAPLVLILLWIAVSEAGLMPSSWLHVSP